MIRLGTTNWYGFRSGEFTEISDEHSWGTITKRGIPMGFDLLRCYRCVSLALSSTSLANLAPPGHYYDDKIIKNNFYS